MTYNDKRNKLIEYGVCTEGELELVEYINGASNNTINDIIFARVGYCDFEQWNEEA